MTRRFGFRKAAASTATFALMATTVAFAPAVGAQATVMCGGEVATIVGTPGNDTLIGTPGNDVIAGLQGNDIIKGAGGDDILCGGIGDDELFGGFGFDVFYGAQGDDLLVASKSKTGPDTKGSRMFGGAGNDEIYGSTGWDRMQGGDGNDRMFGFGGRDWMRGGRGADLLDGGDWIDDMNGGYDNDEIRVKDADTVRGGPGKRDMCLTTPTADDSKLRGCERFSRVRVPAAGTLGEMSMGRANWSSGYVQAAIVRDLLAEVGYTVNDPSDFEFAPDLGYQAIATGEFDAWANSWYPGHLSWWEGELPDGSSIGDNLERVEGSLLQGGGLQGWLVTKSWAEANGVTTLDQINRTPALYNQLDADGDGKGEFYGCPRDWTCDDIMDSQIAFAGWNNLEQVYGGYDANFAKFMASVRDGEPAIMYTWTPTRYIAEALPGELTMFLSVENDSVLDDSNPLGLEGGEFFCQDCAGVSGYTELDPSMCLQGPDGCQIGWQAADIEITANKTWLANNPIARELFNQIQLSFLDMSIAGVELDNSDGTPESVNRIAAAWIAQNRIMTRRWVEAAAAAGAR